MRSLIIHTSLFFSSLINPAHAAISTDAGDLSHSTTGVEAERSFTEKFSAVYVNDFGLLFIDTAQAANEALLHSGNSTALDSHGTNATIADEALPNGAGTAVKRMGYQSYTWQHTSQAFNIDLDETIQSGPLGSVATLDASQFALRYSNVYRNTTPGRAGRWIGSLAFAGNVTGASSAYRLAVPEPSSATFYA